MAITKIILQQMVTMDQNSITASKYPKYTVVLSNSISSITAGELTAAIESSKASAAAAKQSEINAKQSELNAKDSENEAEISAASSQQSATQSASSATASANSAKAAKTSETNAKASETAAKTSETNAKASETAAKTSETNANSSKTAAAASASAAKTSETNAAASASAAKTSETNANSSKTAAANSASAAKTSETNAKTSETNAAASATKAESVASGMRDSIGLGNSVRDCPDISGNPSAYIGFMRIREGVPGWPSIANGEAYLTGFISACDGSPTYTGIFQGWNTRSLYTYRWASNIGPQWTRHARKDEVSRLRQLETGSKETQLTAGDSNVYLYVNSLSWGCYSRTDGMIPLPIANGGTGSRSEAEARASLQVMHERQQALTPTENLNTFDGTKPGFYYQNSNAGASTDRNYPANLAGSLIVTRTHANNVQGCVQTYLPYNANDIFYTRYFVGSAWSSWFEWRGARNSEEFRSFIGLGSSNSPQFNNISLKRVTDVTTGWVAGGLLSSVLVGTTGVERIYGALYPETSLTEPDQLTLHIRSGGVNRYASLNINGEFIVDALKPKNSQQSRRNMNIPTLGMGEIIDVSAPTGVEAGKYYPIIVNAGYYSAYITGFNLDVVTGSSTGDYPMNCCSFNGFFRMGGWSDRKDAGYGYFNRYQQSEVALHSICSSAKSNEDKLFIFVEARAFPVKFRVPVGFTIEVPTKEVIYNQGKNNEIRVPWGVTDPLTSHEALQVMFDFRLNRPGFYQATTEGNYYIGNGKRIVLSNGLTVGDEISMSLPKLIVDGSFLASNGIESSNAIVAKGDTKEKSTFITKLESGGNLYTAEFRSDPSGGQIVVRDRQGGSNDKVFNFDASGSATFPYLSTVDSQDGVRMRVPVGGSYSHLCYQDNSAKVRWRASYNVQNSNYELYSYTADGTYIMSPFKVTQNGDAYIVGNIYSRSAIYSGSQYLYTSFKGTLPGGVVCPDDRIAGNTMIEVSLNSDGSNSYIYFFRRRKDGNRTGEILVQVPQTGGMLALQGTSGREYKKDIKQADTTEALDRIMSLDMVNFIYKDDDKQRVRFGVIAEDAELVAPQYVKHNKEPTEDILDEEGNIVDRIYRDRPSIDVNPIVMDLLGAIQSQQKQIEELKATILKLQNNT